MSNYKQSIENFKKKYYIFYKFTLYTATLVLLLNLAILVSFFFGKASFADRKAAYEEMISYCNFKNPYPNQVTVMKKDDLNIEIYNLTKKLWACGSFKGISFISPILFLVWSPKSDALSNKSPLNPVKN